VVVATWHLSWLDAGMANLGKGGVLFEDDTPDVNAREGILDKPAAMTAAGASENAGCPRSRASRRVAQDRGTILAARLHTQRRTAAVATPRLTAAVLVLAETQGRGRNTVES